MGDKTQGDGSTTVNTAITQLPGYESEKKVARGGAYGVYKDLTAPPKVFPDPINQANPQESGATWWPIDGPGTPIGTYPGRQYLQGEGRGIQRVVRKGTEPYEPVGTTSSVTEERTSTMPRPADPGANTIWTNGL